MGLRFAPTTPDVTSLEADAAEAKRLAHEAMQVAEQADSTGKAAHDVASEAAGKYDTLEELAADYERALTASVEDRAGLHQRIDTIQLKPGPPGKDGINGTNGRDGSDATATVVCGGSIAVPALVLGASTDLTITLNATMPTTTYRVTTVPGSLLGRVGVVVKARTTTSVTITVTATLAVAVGQSITVICS